METSKSQLLGDIQGAIERLEAIRQRVSKETLQSWVERPPGEYGVPQLTYRLVGIEALLIHAVRTLQDVKSLTEAKEFEQWLKEKDKDKK